MVEPGSPGVPGSSATSDFSDHKLDLRLSWCRTGSRKDSRLKGVSVHSDQKEPSFLSPGQAENMSVYPHCQGQNMPPKI